MLLTLSLLLVEPAAAVSDEIAAPVHNYLKGAEPARRCGEKADDGEIVVCGQRDQEAQFRLSEPLPPSPAELPKAEVRVFGDGKLSLHNDAGARGGANSDRIMLTLTKPF